MDELVAWCVAQSDLLGQIMLWLSIGMAILGLPMQILKNYREGECGIHVMIIVMTLVIYFVRIPYSVSKLAWALVPADLIGTILCFVMLG